MAKNTLFILAIGIPLYVASLGVWQWWFRGNRSLLLGALLMLSVAIMSCIVYQRSTKQQ